MKKQSMLLLILFFLISCFQGRAQVSFEDANSVINFLQGEWIWESTCGGYIYMCEYADSVDYTGKLIFDRISGNNDSIHYERFQNDSLQWSMNGALSYLHTIYGDKWSFCWGERSSFILNFIAHDTIYIYMNCFDCDEKKYIRKKVLSDTIAKINFTFGNPDVGLGSEFDEPGWTNVYGTGSFPVLLDNGISISVDGGELFSGNSGEEDTVLPDNVGSTYSWKNNTDSTSSLFIISGLDPGKMYAFDIFSSRDDASAYGDRITTFRIPETGQTVSVNPVGNTNTLISLINVSPSQDGSVTIEMMKLLNEYGYINVLIIREVEQDDDFMLSLETQGAGLISQKTAYYKSGQMATISALSSTGWKFDHWTGDISGTDSITTVNMDTDKHLVAVFSQATGISDDLLNEISLYPNPVKNILSITSTEQILHVDIFDLKGVLKTSINPMKQSFGVEMTVYNSGLYLIRIQTKHKIFRQKIIKE